jgi:hypothetical protein
MNFSFLLIGEWHQRREKYCPAHPIDVGNFKNGQVVSHSCEHHISFATDASGYHQGLETEVS